MVVDVRCGVGIMQDIPVLEVLGFWAHLEMFLEGLVAVDGQEVGLVDAGGRGLVCHGGECELGREYEFGRGG